MTVQQATAILAAKGQITTPIYWNQNAVAGKTCRGDYVAQLLINFAIHYSTTNT